MSITSKILLGGCSNVRRDSTYIYVDRGIVHILGIKSETFREAKRKDRVLGIFGDESTTVFTEASASTNLL